MSGVRLSRHYLPAMVKRGWGRIVFISSESGLNIPVEMIHYGMTKSAQLAISLGLAVSVAGTGVTVNAVLPGPTRSDGAVAFYAKLAAERGLSEDEMERQFIATHRPTSLIRRLATVEEVANMVVYVCSEQASATTGADAGRRRRGAFDRVSWFSAFRRSRHRFGNNDMLSGGCRIDAARGEQSDGQMNETLRPTGTGIRRDRINSAAAN
jgi:NAD(P)-dependent dehydrogenase (short-subunit alcohol dehydrogenase family)